MASLFAERFEASGYDETWNSGETTGTGSIMDEDFGTHLIAKPVGWGKQCLKSVTTGNQCFVQKNNHSWGNNWMHCEFMVAAHNFSSSGQRQRIIGNWVVGGANHLYIIYLYHDGNKLTLQAEVRWDSSTYTYYGGTINLNEVNTVDFKWDVTNDEWEWKVNGSVIASGALETGHGTTNGWFRYGARHHVGSQSVTMYWDNILYDDAEYPVTNFGLSTRTANAILPASMTRTSVRKESGFGVADVVQTFNNVLTLSEELQPIETALYRSQRTVGAQQEAIFRGKKKASWRVTALLQPKGVGQNPDEYTLWELAMGNPSTGATAVEFLFATSPTHTANIRQFVNGSGSGNFGPRAGDAGGNFVQTVFGAMCNRFEIGWGNQGNNGLVQATWQGEGRDYSWTGNTSLSSAGYATTANFPVHNIHALGRGSYIGIGDDVGNFGNRHFIATANYTNGQFAQPGGFGLTAYAPTGTDVYPYAPTYPDSSTTLGTPIHGKAGQLSLDGASTTIRHVGGRVTCRTGMELIHNGRHDEYPSGVRRTGRREVDFQLDFILKTGEEYLLGHSFIHATQNLDIIIGDQAGYKLQLQLPASKFDVTSARIPDRGLTRTTIRGRALENESNHALKIRYI